MPTTIKTGNQRLLKLADFLEKLPPEKFDYSSWVGDGWQGKPDLSCGTTACALGWAASMPEFRRLGLRLFADKGPAYYDKQDVVVVDTKDVLSGDPTQGLWERGRWSSTCPYRAGSIAGNRIFALDDDEADYLFLPMANPPDHFYKLPKSPDDLATAKQVAKHIRRFVKAREAATRN